MSADSSSVGAATLLHPLTLAALAILVINDHLLKQVAPGAFTGKLSDVAGLVLVPLLAAGTIELITRRHLSQSWFFLLIVLVAIGFIALQTLPPVGELYRNGLGLVQYPFRSLFDAPQPQPVHLTQDPTDLFTLPALWAAWYCRGQANST